MNEVAKRVIQNTGFLYGRMLISIFIILYTTRLVLNTLGESDFGIFNVVGGVIALLSFVSASVSASTQRYLNYHEGAGNLLMQKRIFNVSLVLHLLVSAVMVVCLLVVGYFCFQYVLNIPPERTFAAQVVFASLIVSVIGTIMTAPYEAAINAHENMKFYAILGVADSVLKLIIAYVTIYSSGDKLITYGFLMAFLPFFTFGVSLIYCHRHYEECEMGIKRYWDEGLMKELLGFAGWSFVGTSSAVISNYGAGLVLNHFFGTLLNAAHGIGIQVIGQLMAFARHMLKALNPVIAKSEGAGNRQQMITASLMGCKFSYFILAFFAIPAMVEMPYILEIWLKNVPQWTVIISRLLLIRSLIEHTTIVFSSSLAAEGRIKALNKWVCFVELLPLVLSYVLFYFGFSPIWMYIVGIVTYGLMFSAVHIYYMHANCGMAYSDFFYRVALPVVGLTLIVFAIDLVPLYFMAQGMLRLVIVLLLSTLTFCVALFFVGLSSNERALFVQLLQKIRLRRKKEKNDID